MVANPRASAGAGTLRPLNGPIPATVEASSRGLPRAVLWRGVFRRVASIRETWRIDDEWWRDEIARRYFVVELEGGVEITLYQDLLREAWFEQHAPAPARSGK